MTTYDMLEGCSDGGCIIKRPEGMHTNGGCQCEKELMRGVPLELRRRIVTALRFYQGFYREHRTPTERDRT